MAFIKQSWEQIQVLLSRLGPTEKGLIASLFIIMLFVGAVLLQYAGQPETVALSGFSAENAAVVVSKLKSRGIEASLDGGQIRIPKGRQAEALAVMGQHDLLSQNFAQAFDQYMQDQSPWVSSHQRDRAYLIAKQKVLSNVIGHMAGIKSAMVIIDKPRQDRLTRPVRPTSSVTVTMNAGYMVNQGLVRSIAGMVSGAVADMTITDVVVIDANQGRSYTVKTGINDAPTQALEIVKKLESETIDKIKDLLYYIPGVKVAVSIRTSSRGPGQVQEYKRGTESLVSERTDTQESKSIQDAGRAGARANTETEIGPASQDGNSQSRQQSETRYGEKPLDMVQQYQDAGHQLEQVNVTVNVPRSYLVNIHQQQNPDGKTPADQAAIDSLAAVELQKVKDIIKPLTKVGEEFGLINTEVINDSLQLAAVAEAQNQGGGMGEILQSEWIRSMGLGAMALGAMMLMLTMTKKASQEPDLPSAEQLAGVPPTLPSDDELIGEAEESAHTMAGMELDDEELEHRKVVEQISELISTNPEEAAMILRKWVRVDD